MNEEASMDQLFLNKVHEAIENNMANGSFGVDELAHELRISRSQLHRRLKSINGQSASRMIREYRLNRAHEMLQQKVGTVSEISYQVGFSSPSYFNTCFHEYFGYPPGKVKRIRSKGSINKYTIPRKLLFIFLGTLVLTVTVLFIYFETRIIDKSIAVLPILYLSNDLNELYLADAVMDAIRQNLSTIEDLRVMSRSSVEQYRNTDKTASQICKEQKVRYLIESSFQKQGDQVRIIVYLIRPSRREQHLWTEEYNRKWEDIFAVQSEVAINIARELQAVITPEEKQLIEKIPTISLTAYDFYMRGMDDMEEYWVDRSNTEALEKAEDNFHKALAYDSTFALTYTGLGHVYWNKHLWKTLLSEEFLDSVLILADNALSFDNQLAEAYVLRGSVFWFSNKREQAINEFDKAIKLNPNIGRAYLYKGGVYLHDDLIKSIDNYHKAASLLRGPFLPKILRRIGGAYAIAGFNERALYYHQEALKLDDDSAAYFSDLAHMEQANRNYENAIEFGERSYTIDSTDIWVCFQLGCDHAFLGQFEESLDYMKKFARRLETADVLRPNNSYRIGYAYWVNGFEEIGESYIYRGLEMLDSLTNQGLHYVKELQTFYHRAAIYAFLEDNDQAFENLRNLNRWKRMPSWMVGCINDDPMFDSLRDEPEFQQIVRDVEAKYQAEHERVREWLEEQGMWQ